MTEFVGEASVNLGVKMRQTFKVLLISFFLALAGVSNADMQRGINNYKAIMAGHQTIEQLSDQEAREVMALVSAMKGQVANQRCSGAIESQITGEFEGWDGDTLFKLTNGQIWQQSSYAYTYHYAYRPEVIIYSANGGCKLKVDGVDDSIFVRRLK